MRCWIFIVLCPLQIHCVQEWKEINIGSVHVFNRRQFFFNCSSLRQQSTTEKEMFHSSDIIGIANSDWDSKWIHTSGTMLSFQSAKQVGLSKLIYIYICPKDFNHGKKLPEKLGLFHTSLCITLLHSALKCFSNAHGFIFTTIHMCTDCFHETGCYNDHLSTHCFVCKVVCISSLSHESRVL